MAKNCYNAACVQRAFQEANDRFKNFVIRYSGRVGSALANSYLSSGGSVITEACVNAYLCYITNVYSRCFPSPCMMIRRRFLSINLALQLGVLAEAVIFQVFCEHASHIDS